MIIKKTFEAKYFTQIITSILQQYPQYRQIEFYNWIKKIDEVGFCKNKEHYYIYSDYNSMPIGYFSFCEQEKSVYINAIYIHFNNQKSGLGGEIIQYIKKSHQHKKLVLDVDENMNWVIEFYRKNDFEYNGKSTRYSKAIEMVANCE